MAMIKPIRSDADHREALARVDALMDAAPGTPEGDELDVLVDLIEHYESKRLPLGQPSPAAALRFRMEQAGLTPRDLVPLIGSVAEVSAILAGKRELTLSMARALHEELGIPAEALLAAPGGIVTGKSRSRG
jgi:HTH-type transcriptional regulator/antitoxin HigA